MRDVEYDRFGPWTLEITEEDAISPLFLPHVDQSLPTIMQFKVPRQIERRNARPGMNLYDALVTLYENEVEDLQRVGEDVKRHTMAYSDIRAVRVFEDLLHGFVSYVGASESISFSFNTVSQEVITKMTTLLRTRFPAGGSPPEAIAPNEEFLGVHFSRLLASERAHEPGSHLFGAEGQTRVASDAAPLLKRLWHGLIDKRTYESLHFSDGKELKAIGRGRAFRYRGTASYQVDRVYAPLHAIDAVEWQDHPRDPEVVMLNYRIGNEVFSYAMLKRNETIPHCKAALEALTATSQVGAR